MNGNLLKKKGDCLVAEGCIRLLLPCILLQDFGGRFTKVFLKYEPKISEAREATKFAHFSYGVFPRFKHIKCMIEPDGFHKIGRRLTGQRLDFFIEQRVADIHFRCKIFFAEFRIGKIGLSNFGDPFYEIVIQIIIKNSFKKPFLLLF